MAILIILGILITLWKVKRVFDKLDRDYRQNTKNMEYWKYYREDDK